MMKRTAAVFIILLVSTCYGQQDSRLQLPMWLGDDGALYVSSTVDENPDSLCVERGHIQGDDFSSTLAYCPPIYVDLPDMTLRIDPVCNITSCNCLRCGKRYALYGGRPDTTVIWRREGK